VKKLIVEVIANENASRAANPNVPFTPAEIALDAHACCEAGASLVHFHVRAADGAPDLSAEGTAATIRAIRERTDVLVLPAAANTSGAAPEQRIANIISGGDRADVQADLLAVEMGAGNLDAYDPKARRLLSEQRMFANDHATIRTLLSLADQARMRPFLVSFNVSWTRSIQAALEMGMVQAPVAIGLIHGGASFIAAHPATVAGLDAHLSFLPSAESMEWMACAHRANVLAIAAAAIERGGHVGIGLGDHPYTELGQPTNAQLVSIVVDLARAMGREVATPDEARAMLGVGG
jgi:3-keto-5-aminohexanoate cleavage enzyme